MGGYRASRLRDASHEAMFLGFRNDASQTRVIGTTFPPRPQFLLVDPSRMRVADQFVLQLAGSHGRLFLVSVNATLNDMMMSSNVLRKFRKNFRGIAGR